VFTVRISPAGYSRSSPRVHERRNGMSVLSFLWARTIPKAFGLEAATLNYAVEGTRSK